MCVLAFKNSIIGAGTGIAKAPSQHWRRREKGFTLRSTWPTEQDHSPLPKVFLLFHSTEMMLQSLVSLHCLIIKVVK